MDDRRVIPYDPFDAISRMTPEEKIEELRYVIDNIIEELKNESLTEFERKELLREKKYTKEMIAEYEKELANPPEDNQGEQEGEEEKKELTPLELLEKRLEERVGEQEEQEGDGLMRDPTMLPPQARALLEKIGNEEIKSIKIIRSPLSSFTKTFLNLISLGQFEKISKKYYDQIFHLSIWINDKYNLEKNEVIAFNQTNPKKENSEVREVNNIPAGITFQTLIDKTKARMGTNFGVYNGESNNCQDFITNIFKANGIGEQGDFDFIKQNTKEIFEKLPAFSKALGNAATSAGAIFNRLLYGQGPHEQEGGCQCGSGSSVFYNYQLPISKCKF